MNNRITNPTTVVSQTIEMNNRDIISSILISEKNISNTLNIFLNEASNEKLYDQIFEIFESIKETARELYTIMFKNGWYSLEMVDNNIIMDNIKNMQRKLKELE